MMLTRALHALGAFLGTPAGFWATMAATALSIALAAYSLSIATFALSVLAIILPAFILVEQHAKDQALHLKLDELIRAIEPADNSLRHVEKLSPEIIAAKAHQAELGG